MGFDVNNNFRGTWYGKDRLGMTTPDCDASDPLQPFLPVGYPAPWLPIRRRDEGHPVAAGVVLSSGYLVGVDKSGGLVPAGMRSGSTGPGGPYVVLVYGSDDVGFSYNPQAARKVLTTGEYALIGAPSDVAGLIPNVTVTTTVATANAPATAVFVDGAASSGASGAAPVAAGTIASVSVGTYLSFAGVSGVSRVTALNGLTATLDQVASAVNGAAVSIALPVINGVQIQAADVTFARTCDLIPGGTARALGYALRNTYQYLGGVRIFDPTGGMLYLHESMNPSGYTVTNYMHEMMTAIRTSFVLRMPWIGATPNTLQALATADGLTALGYVQDDWSRSFTHFTGPVGREYGQLFPGCSVVASDQNGALDAGHFSPYNPAWHCPDQICGRVLGVEKLFPIRDYTDRVRTQFDRAEELVGPWREPNPVQMMMGGSATRGLDYQVNISGGGVFRQAKDQSKPIHDEYGTYVYVLVNTQ